VTGTTRPLVLTAAEVAEASGGRLRRGSTSREIGSFTTDSRKVAPGQFFIALRGDRFDGAAYAAASVEAGASFALTERQGAPPDHPVSLDCPEGEYLQGLWLRRSS